MKRLSDSVAVFFIRMLRHALPVFMCFLALLPAQVLFPSKALAVDVVLVSSNMRYIDLTQHIKRVRQDIYDFAIQNTGDEIMYLTLELSHPDIFHIATF